MKIPCYRFGNLPEYNLDDSLINLKKRALKSKLHFDSCIPVGVTERDLYSNIINGELFATLYKIKKGSNIIVLTNKEKNLIYDCGIIFTLNVISLEQFFPFLDNVCYLPDSYRNYQNLLKKIAYLKKRHIDLDFFIKFYNFCDKKIKRKIHDISLLDRVFYFFPITSYQEVFKFKENRVNRSILALDFNSMFSDAMSGYFPNPKDLKIINLNRIYIHNESLKYGIYKVSLRHPDLFISQYHPFRFFFLFKYYPFSVSENDIIETFLTNKEIEYYSKHFREIYLSDAIVSDNTILHPLVVNRDQLYAERMNYKKQENTTLAKLNKQLLAMLHSVSNAKINCSTNFDNPLEIYEFLSEKFGVVIPKNLTPAELMTLLDRKNFFLTISGNYLKLTYPNNIQNTNIYSLYAFVISNARLKMMKTIEYLLEFSNLDICYANVDSIHVSIPKDRREEFVFFLKDKELLGEKLGQLKIENYSDYGLWLSPGKYWLYNSDKIIQSRNSCLQQDFDDNHNNIRMKKKYYIPNQINEFTVSKECNLSLRKTLSVRKKLLNYSFLRFSVNEIENCNSQKQKEIKDIFLQEVDKLKNFISKKTSPNNT